MSSLIWESSIKKSHRQAIEKLKARWFSMYLQQERKWTEKIKGYKQQLEETRKLIQQTTEIAFEGIYNREPPRCYPLFLHDRWAVFRLRQLAAGQPHKIKQPDDFVSMYISAEMKDHNLLCELYYEHSLPIYSAFLSGKRMLNSTGGWSQRQVYM
jgi:hypothetical protein